MLTGYNFFKRLFLALSIFMLAQGSMATMYSVTSAGGLVNAMLDHNSNASADIIDLGGSVIEITEDCSTSTANNLYCYGNHTAYAAGNVGLPEVTGTLTIMNGRILRKVVPLPAAPFTTFTSSNYFRIFTVYGGASLTLYNVTVENGLAASFPDASPYIPLTGTNVGGTDEGGCIYNEGTLTLNNTAIKNCYANDSGGAIYNAVNGLLDLQTTVLSHNIANAASAVNNPAGTTAGGGAIFNSATLTSIINSMDNNTISYNITPGFGAGINNQAIAVNILNSTFSNNACCVPIPGAGECHDGDATGAGGAIYNDASAIALEVVQSTFNGNSAYQGGAIYNASLAVPTSNIALSSAPSIPTMIPGTTIISSTIAGNTANQGGGGIYDIGHIFVLWSNIVAANIDTQEYSVRSPDVFTLNGYIAENVGFNLIGNCGAFYNSITSKYACGIINNDLYFDIVGSDVDPIDPRLEALNWNGGPTQTMAIKPGSPALNNGNNPFDLANDQRLEPYNRQECGMTDIGAYEAQICFADNAR